MSVCLSVRVSKTSEDILMCVSAMATAIESSTMCCWRGPRMKQKRVWESKERERERGRMRGRKRTKKKARPRWWWWWWWSVLFEHTKCYSKSLRMTRVCVCSLCRAYMLLVIILVCARMFVHTHAHLVAMVVAPTTLRYINSQYYQLLIWFDHYSNYRSANVKPPEVNFECYHPGGFVCLLPSLLFSTSIVCWSPHSPLLPLPVYFYIAPHFRVYLLTLLLLSTSEFTSVDNKQCRSMSLHILSVRLDNILSQSTSIFIALLPYLW